MPWLVTIVTAFPICLMGFVALGPVKKVKVDHMVLAVACATFGSLLLAGHAPSLLGLLPCKLQPFSPPCQNLQVEATAGTYLALTGLIFWALSGLSLYLPRNSRNKRS